MKAGNYDDIPGYLDNIVDEINYLISGVEEYGIVDLDITVEAFADIVVGLVQVRHC